MRESVSTGPLSSRGTPSLAGSMPWEANMRKT